MFWQSYNEHPFVGVILLRQLFRREDLDVTEVRELLELFDRFHYALHEHLVVDPDRDIRQVGQPIRFTTQDADDCDIESGTKCRMPNQFRDHG